MALDTEYFDGMLSGSQSVDELVDMMFEYEDELVDVSRVLRELCENRGLSVSQFISRCSFSRSNKASVEGWFDGCSEPRGRAQYVKIAIGLGMTVEEADRFLVRVGGFGRLCPKNLSDAACISVLRRRGSFAELKELTARLELLMNDIIYEQIKSCLPEDYIYQRESIPEGSVAERRKALDALAKQYGTEWAKAFEKLRASLVDSDEHTDTEELFDLLSSSQNIDIEKFICDHWRDILAANHRLIEYIDCAISHRAHTDELGKPVNTIGGFIRECTDEPDFGEGGCRVITDNAANIITKQISRLRTYGETPSREVLIALGIVLKMGLDDLNNMLDIAGMEQLCTKRGAEAALRYALLRWEYRGSVEPADSLDTLREFMRFYDGQTVPDLINMLLLDD